MQKLELEREFSIEASRHIKAILVEKMRRYYETLSHTGVQLPYWLQDKPIEKAKKAVRQYICTHNYDDIIRLYEQAYQEVYNV